VSGTFTATGGQIIGPNGKPFVAEGIDVMEGNQPSVSTLQTDFPGINFVRLAIYDYASPTALEAYVNSLTAAGIVVELEDHSNGAGNAGGGQGTIFTGQALTTELGWYSSIASAFKNNPYVWFGTDNEPSEVNAATGQTDPSALSTWQLQTYDAIRDTGNNNPIMLEANSFGVGNTNTGYTASDYAGMTNTIWDMHYYGWLSGYSTNQATVTQTLDSIASEAQQITSADGTMPVIIGEYGNSTSGTTIDANANEVISAVQNSGYGSAAWAWGAGNPGDGLSNGGNGLSAYGQQIAAGIAAAASKTGSLGSTATVTPSANDTVVKAGSTSAITDAAGNAWTLTAAGAVDENGTAAAYSSGVAEIAYVNGTVWQENATGQWWGWGGTDWTLGAGTTTSPLPAAPPPPVVSANDTVVTAGSTAAITDASGNVWTITSGGQVAVNGTADTTTSYVIELAYVNGVIWQENTGDLWWSKSSPTAAWGPTLGTATSPLPAAPPPPTPSANDTVVTAGTTAAITDAAGNAWTIATGGVVDENGAAAGFSSGVTELAYVNGAIWQENASNLWWQWNGTNWGTGAGTATSPLPATAPLPTPDAISINGAATSAPSTVTGDTFALTASTGLVTAVLGTSTMTLVQFTGSTGVSVTGGAAGEIVTAAAGANTFTAGSGFMDVTGGSGADSYIYHAGSGALVINDFSVAKGDSLMIDSGLKTAMTQTSDGSGGTLLAFGGSAAIDLRGVATVPATAIHWGS
jgi:hypothetical protein